MHGVGSAGNWGALAFVAVVATCVGEGGQGAFVGWDGASTVEIQGLQSEKLEEFVDVQFEMAYGLEVALAWSLVICEGAVGAHSSEASGSLGVLEADNHYVDVAANDLGMPAGIGEEHQAAGACIHVGRLVGSVEELEGQEQPLVQSGTRDAVVAQQAGDIAADASAAVAEVQGFGLGLEQASLVEALNGGRPPSVGVRCSQLKLQVGQGVEM